MGSNSFIDDKSFIRWVKYGEDDSYWQKFIEENPQSEEQLMQAKDMIESIHVSDTPSPSDSLDVWKGIYKKMQDNQPLRGKKHRPKTSMIILVILGVVSWYFWQQSKAKAFDNIASNERWIEYTNNSQTNWPLDLADGSQVILEPDAYLKYPAKFDQKTRQVLLKGDAFFDIAHDSLAPFYVYANEAVIRVIGTSFFVKAEEDDKDVEVIVKSGKVAVYRSKEVKQYQSRTIKEIQPIIVTPNQIATLKKSNLEFNKRLVTTPSLVRSLKKMDKIYFEESSIYEIIEALELAYGVEIELDESIKESCRLTTTLTDQPLFEKLKIICDPLGLDYQEKDVRIYITGSCQ